jgi:hypothetical protein
MGFWPFKKKQVAAKPLEFSTPHGSPPAYLQAAFGEAAKHPLDDMVYRLVIASPQRHIVTEIGAMTMSTYLDAHEKAQKGDPTESRLVSAQVLAAVFDKGLRPEGEALDVVRFAAFAFFDREFTRGSNKGKTHETAWNTLALEVESSPEKVRVARRAVRIEYPDGPIDLSSPFGGLFNPLR